MTASLPIEEPASALEWATSPAILFVLVALGFAATLVGRRRWTLRIWLFCARLVEVGAIVVGAWAIAPVPTKTLRWAWRVGPWTLCALASVGIVGAWIVASGAYGRARMSTRRTHETAIGYRDAAGAR